jgi:hypothetical protein
VNPLSSRCFVWLAPWSFGLELELQIEKLNLNPTTSTLDVNEMASSGAVTPASPKVVKIKAAQPGVAQFGCGKSEQNFPVSQLRSLASLLTSYDRTHPGILDGPSRTSRENHNAL